MTNVQRKDFESGILAAIVDSSKPIQELVSNAALATWAKLGFNEAYNMSEKDVEKISFNALAADYTRRGKVVPAVDPKTKKVPAKNDATWNTRQAELKRAIRFAPHYDAAVKVCEEMGVGVGQPIAQLDKSVGAVMEAIGKGTVDTWKAEKLAKFEENKAKRAEKAEKAETVEGAQEAVTNLCAKLEEKGFEFDRKKLAAFVLTIAFPAVEETPDAGAAMDAAAAVAFPAPTQPAMNPADLEAMIKNLPQLATMMAAFGQMMQPKS